jgi:hypothetical protein
LAIFFQVHIQHLEKIFQQFKMLIQKSAEESEPDIAQLDHFLGEISFFLRLKTNLPK